MTRKLLFLVLLVLSAEIALADSEGYFCTAKGYVAYETRFTEPQPAHRLHIVRFGSRIGIAQPVTVSLEDFQVHAMRCGDERIEIQGWDTKYVIDMSDPSLPRLAGKEDIPKPGEVLAGFSARNLGNWSKPAVHVLDSDDAESVFEIVIARAEKPVKGGIFHYTISELVRRGAGSHGTIREALTLFRQVFRESNH